jgi:ABC-type transport system involved in multi-copper enzyme maturation permease subunit
MRWRDVWLVAAQELRLRVRTGRWRWLMVAWLVVIGGFTLLADLAFAANSPTGASAGPGGPDPWGGQLFSLIVLFVLGLVLIVTPALTAQSINGDRERGTLATLQVTRLRPLDIALGKLLAGWLVGLVALGLTLPFAGFALYRGGVGVWRVPVVYVVTALLMGVVCAVAQALSASLARGVTSTMLSYVVVFALTVGTFIAFGLVGEVLRTERTVTLGSGLPHVVEDARPDLVWWLVVPNPFVVVIDAAPAPPTQALASDDPLLIFREDLRGNRRPPGEFDVDFNRSPIWPYGLGFNLLLGAGALWLTVRRLRAPVRKLPRGVRVA